MPRSGSDIEIGACIVLYMQELHRGMGILPWAQMCLPQSITLLFQKTNTGVFDEIISWVCRGHLIYITSELLTHLNISESKVWEHFTSKRKPTYFTDKENSEPGNE